MSKVTPIRPGPGSAALNVDELAAQLRLMRVTIESARQAIVTAALALEKTDQFQDVAQALRQQAEGALRLIDEQLAEVVGNP